VLFHTARLVRVAIVATSYPNHPGDPAGHFVRTEALSLAAAGFDVHVIVPAARDGTITSDPVRRWAIEHGGVFGWPGATARLACQPWRAPGAAAFAWTATDRLRALRPDRIVAHWIVPSAFPIAVGARTPAEIECVAHGGDVRLLCRLPAPARDFVVRRLIARSRRIRFVASALLDQLCAVISPGLEARLRKIAMAQPCALDLPDVAARTVDLRNRFPGAKLLTAVGRLVPSKRVELAIAAANLIGHDVRLCVVGDGPERARLQGLDRVGNVAFVGALDRPDALAWIAASRVMIHASAQEAAPTTVREARMLGVPVVACDAGDLARWARGDAGIRVVAPDATAIADAIVAMA